ncbi:Stp1/IreP family PP2C-type Ser/Thr phosphatase [Fusibacter sp. JL216-2]|uniref:Stp1/IreP family PP2C-type Ser/Thr phosphatase n=1 Tax=Fusibacter sp. JL216-2 TaxID=3071453 RepID=UPI003D33DAE6
MEAYARTHTGKVRTNNEDCYFVSEKGPKLFVVADGMGGHNAGEVASRVAVDAVKDFISEQLSGEASKDQVEEVLLGSIRHANAKVYELSRSNSDMEGMGTTLTLLLIDNDMMFFAHVGDSRAYFFKNGDLEQITDDHSLVGELVRAGTITEEQARVHPQKNILTNAVGTGLTVKIDLLQRIVESGIILLCTDGLTTHVSEEEIIEIMSSEASLEAICNALVDSANEAGGQDNITVVAVKCS